MRYIYLNISRIYSEVLIDRYGEIVKEFRKSSKRIVLGYYVLFMIRRYILVICLHLLRNYPIVQVTTVSLFCWIVAIHLIVYRPYLDITNNLTQIIVEICVAAAYTGPLFLLNGVSDQETIGWVIFISANLSYIIQLLPILIKVSKKLYTRYRSSTVV
jgi:hypothetical protein